MKKWIIVLLCINLVFCGCLEKESDNPHANIPPKANFNWYPSEKINTREIITFTSNSVDPDGAIVNWTWNLDDKIMGYGKTIEYQFDNAGVCSIKLTVKDNNDDIDWITYTINVETTKINTSFSYNPIVPVVSEIIQFFDTSDNLSNDIVSWHWDFGDGVTSSEKNPIHKYSTDRIYTVNLTTSDNKNNKNSFSREIDIKNDEISGEVIVIEDTDTIDFFKPSQYHEGYWDIDRSEFLEHFYGNYDDFYDFIILVPTKLTYVSSSIPYNREITGIGLDTNEGLTKISQKRLKSCITLSLYNYYFYAGNTTNNFDISNNFRTFSHEIGHHWLVHINLSGYYHHRNHWINNLDLFSGDTRYSDPMAYAHWIINGDQEICIDISETITRFSNLSLYLMGLLPPEKVPPVYVHEFEEYEDCDYNLIGPFCLDEPNFINNVTVTIDDIINDYGERNPSYEISQKNFRVLFVVVTENEEDATPDFLEYINQIRLSFPVLWNNATLGISEIEC